MCKQVVYKKSCSSVRPANGGVKEAIKLLVQLSSHAPLSLHAAEAIVLILTKKPSYLFPDESVALCEKWLPIASLHFIRLLVFYV